MKRHSNYKWSILLCLVTFSLGSIENALACKAPIPIQRSSVELSVEPPVSSDANCLSIVKVWEDDSYGGDYGLSLTNRCESVVNLTIEGCDEQCPPIPLEIGKNTKVARREIDHPDDENGQLTFLWSDGTYQGKIRLKATYTRITLPPCPSDEEEGCSITSLTTHKPSSWLLLSLAMVLLVRTRRQQ